jgi:NTP pyrophosphatase (non-canonical NTP hydrolase)
MNCPLVSDRVGSDQVCISEFEQIIKDKVRNREQEMGKQFLLNAPVEEMGELSRALRKGTESKVAEEIFDMIFAVTSVANLAEVDVESLLKQKYVDRPFSEIGRNWADVTWK